MSERMIYDDGATKIRRQADGSVRIYQSAGDRIRERWRCVVLSPQAVEALREPSEAPGEAG